MIKIGGFLPLSLIDYPEKLSAVVFTQGCPFRCLFCHNPSLVIPEKYEQPISLEELFSFLKKRKGKLDGVVISGGEPTIQKGLLDFILKIKELGFLVKLDTSGVSPTVLAELLSRGLLDYIAMDIKAPLSKYEKITSTKIISDNLKESIALIIKKAPDYEFRTTLVPELHTLNDVEEMAKTIQGAKRYVLQNFQPAITLSADLKKQKFSNSEMENFKNAIAKYIPLPQIR